MLYVFDINETLLGLGALDEVLGGAERRRAWFDLVIRTALTRTAADDYRPFGAIGLECATALGSDVTSDDLHAAMSSLPAWPDVATGLEALVRAGHEVVALGNSALELIETQLSNAGIRSCFAATYSADTVHALKPARAAYESVLTARDVAPHRATLVAAHDWDIAGAAAAGMRTAFLDRGLASPLPGFEPDQTVRAVGDLLAAS